MYTRVSQQGKGSLSFVAGTPLHLAAPRCTPPATLHCASCTPPHPKDPRPALQVTWQLENHHGGGYQYRLCPADEPLTEACFQRTPLEFATDQQGVVFKGSSHSWVPVNGTFVTEGTQPAGETRPACPMVAV